MIRYSHFKIPNQFFHFSFQYQSSGWFKELDWIKHCRTINGLALTHNIECIAYVMMDTHSHMLIRSYSCKENFFSEEILKTLSPQNQETEYLEPINSTSQFLGTYRYIYRNPVEARISRTCESYSFSTLNSLLGYSVQRLVSWDYMNVIQNPTRVLQWLNKSEDTFSQKTW